MGKEYSTRFFDLAFTDGTPRKALLTACVVGTILAAINHGDTILSGEYPPIAKILLTYCVPFCVTTWGSYLGKRDKILQQQQIDIFHKENKSSAKD
tara:strand:+ start:170 stop:457 length:288 start_codon:yes stop_codon:yes gene_type:complete